MLRKRLIPTLLLREGRLVKGVGYRNHRDAGRPETTARAHDAQSADEIVILDIDASRNGRPPDFEALRLVAAECYMPVTMGGGIRSRDDACRAMDAGADKITITTTALDNPSLIDDLARLLGAQAVVLGVDVWRSGSEHLIYDFRTDRTRRDGDPMSWIGEAVDRGAGEIRLMSAEREGKRCGMDLELIAGVKKRFKVPIVAEGGAGTLEHLAEGLEAGADGVCVGTMLVFSDNNLVKIRRFLNSRGCELRA